MKIIIYLIFWLSLTGVSAQTCYSRVRICGDESTIILLHYFGIDYYRNINNKCDEVICELSDKELNLLIEADIDYQVIIQDVQAYYKERNSSFVSKLKDLKYAANINFAAWPVPQGFNYGTIGGYYSIEEMVENLDSMAMQYPDLVTVKHPMDYQTNNGRDLYWVRISDNPNTDEDEPEILYTGMHHAREPIGMQLLFYYMYYILENYETDTVIRNLVDNFELYFVPMVNPDGYAYNIQNYPNGGGMWRKNRRQNEDGSYGVDLNRNYSFQWGFDNIGSSPNPWADNFRGTEAFSEPESANMRNFCEDHEFRIALNYHSYKNELLYTWGWSGDPCEHEAILDAYAKIVSCENGYIYGATNTTLYPTNGGSDDWMYGDVDTKDLILSYTSEVGTTDDGFWPAISRIIPLCQENMYQNIMVAMLSGPYATVRDLSPSILINKGGLLFFKIERLGLEDNATYTVSIEPLNDAIAEINGPFIFSNLAILESASSAFTYSLKDDIQQGEVVEYLLSVNNGIANYSDTIRKVYGMPNVIFEDSANNLSQWNSNQWNTTNLQYHSPDSSVTDSPDGEYQNNENSVITLKNPIDLTGVLYASLSYWAKWDIQEQYDYVQVLISSDNGVTWIPMQGKYTERGNYLQAFKEPLYDGIQNTWVKEEINIEQFIGQEIYIGFKLISNGFGVADGFFWDDMTVTVVDQATGIDSDQSLRRDNLISIQPNPASETAVIRINSDKMQAGDSKMLIYNALGKLIYEIPVNRDEKEMKLDVAVWPAGVYFCGVESGNVMISVKKLIVR